MRHLTIIGLIAFGLVVGGAGSVALDVTVAVGLFRLLRRDQRRALAATGRPTTVLLGARSAADLIGRDDFAALSPEGVELVCATEDGSDHVLLLVVHTLPEQASPLLPTPLVKTVAEKSFGATVTGDTVVLPGIVSRKKQIIPNLTL